jgi:small subunit ribosomal protein S11
MAYKKRLKKVKRQVETAIAHVKSTFNNTIVSVTTLAGDVLLRGSAGMLGFKGARKSTPFAASQIVNKLVAGMVEVGVSKLEINLEGPGSGRDSVVRSLQAAGFRITKLRDVTPVPHNGPRPPKKRRV